MALRGLAVVAHSVQCGEMEMDIASLWSSLESVPKVLDRGIDLPSSRQRPGESVVGVGSVGVRFEGSLEESNGGGEPSFSGGDVSQTEKSS